MERVSAEWESERPETLSVLATRRPIALIRDEEAFSGILPGDLLDRIEHVIPVRIELLVARLATADRGGQRLVARRRAAGGVDLDRPTPPLDAQQLRLGVDYTGRRGRKLPAEPDQGAIDAVDVVGGVVWLS